MPKFLDLDRSLAKCEKNLRYSEDALGNAPPLCVCLVFTLNSCIIGVAGHPSALLYYRHSILLLAEGDVDKSFYGKSETSA